MGAQERRKMLGEAQKLIDQLEGIKQDLMDKLNEIAEDARESFDNMPESLQGSESGSRLEEIADTAESLASDVDSMEIPDLSDLE